MRNVARDEAPKERVPWLGLDLAIEVEGGDLRHPGTEFEKQVPHEWVGYGYFEGVKAPDGDSLDAIIGPMFYEDHNGPDVAYVAEQLGPDGAFKQFKVLLGFTNEEAARAAFLAMWPEERLGEVRAVPANELAKNIKTEGAPMARTAEKPKFCSHCGEKVTANELFGRDDRWFHRPCITKGPISLDKNAMPMMRQLPPHYALSIAPRQWSKDSAKDVLEARIVDKRNGRLMAEIDAVRVSSLASKYPVDESRWQISFSKGEHGFGAFLYEKLLEHISARGETLEPGAATTSSARNVWQKYFERPDVTHAPAHKQRVDMGDEDVEALQQRYQFPRKGEQLTRGQYRELVHKSVKAKELGQLEGFTVYRVDGEWVRDKVDVNFRASANSASSKFIPDGEVWVEADLSDKDMAARIVREVVECDALLSGQDGALGAEAERAFRAQYDGGNAFRSAEKFLAQCAEPDEVESANMQVADDLVVQGSIEVTAADLGGLQLKRKGYQRYVAEHVDEEGETHKVWIGGEHKVEHGSYSGNSRQRRKTMWVVKVDGEEIGEEKSLKAAREMAEAHLGIVAAPAPVVHRDMNPANMMMAPANVLAPPPAGPDPLAALRVGTIELDASMLVAHGPRPPRVNPKPEFMRIDAPEEGPSSWIGHEPPVTELSTADLPPPAALPPKAPPSAPSEWMGHAPPPSAPVEDPVFDPRLHRAPDFVKPPKSTSTGPKGPLPPIAPAPALSDEEEAAEAARKKKREEEKVSPEAFKRAYDDLQIKPNTKPGDGFENIMNVLSKADPKEIEFYGKWYDQAHEDVTALARRYRKPLPVVAGIVAVLSPGMPWEKNLELAERILQGHTRSSAWPENVAKARHILKYGDLSVLTTGQWGPKVGPFFESIASPASQRRRIVVDGHATNIWRGKYEPLQTGWMPETKESRSEGISIGQAERAAMINDYQRAGDAVGLTPQAVQAITWVVWRELVERHRTEQKAKERAEKKKKSADYDGFGLVVPLDAVRELGAAAVGRLVRLGWRFVDASIEVTADDLDKHAITPRDPAFGPEFHDVPAPEPKRAPTTLMPPGTRKRPGEIALKPNGGFQNIMKVLALATPAELDFWGRWYAFAHSTVEEMAGKYGLPFETVAGVVAVLSPGNKWHQNVIVAKQVIEWWKGQQEYGAFSTPELSGVGGPVWPEEDDVTIEVDESDLDDEEEVAASRAAALGDPYTFTPAKNQPSGAPATVMKERKGPKQHPLGLAGPHPAGYPANVQKALRMLGGESPESVITGPKVTIFYQTIVDPDRVSKPVLDGHAINIWRGEKLPLKGLRQPNQGEREAMERDYARAAQQSNLTIHGVQAITWFIWKSIQNPKTAALSGSVEEARTMLARGFSDIALVGGSTSPLYLRPGQAEELIAQYGDEVQVRPLAEYTTQRPAVAE